ncbi:hypothetical protein [Colwellia piezophila]|uniref:hypothetical protein n=1 Tax=Colwellia piezophila TaxID=211668 RepID=UPI000372551A|nr:hypothetical protein [Colwellia piezophila]
MFKGLQVETSLALHYPSPYYFFVSNENVKLKNRIEIGLINAEKDGSFQQLFESHRVTKNMLLSAKLERRKIFKLKNAFLSKETQRMVEKTALFNTSFNSNISDRLNNDAKKRLPVRVE